MGETIKVRAGDLGRIESALGRLGGTDQKPNDLTVELAWNIAKNIGIVERSRKDYTKARTQMVKASGLVAGEDLRPAHAEQFSQLQDKMEELDNREIELEGILLIPKATLLKKGNVVLPDALASLMMFITE